MELDATTFPAAKGHIHGFDTSEDNYTVYKPSDLGFSSHESNVVLSKGVPSAGFKFLFSESSKNCRVFIGERVGAINLTISISASNCIIYFGDRCSFKKGSMSVCEDGDAIIIGNNVTAMPDYMWTTGHHSGVKGKSIIVGDDCMFSKSVTLRASDGHPVFNIESDIQINKPYLPIILEPHCWIGQGVMILKNVKIGACSIVAAGAIVTKSCRRYSMMSGVPAVRKDIEGFMWSRNQSDKERDNARKWVKKYPPIKKPWYRKVMKIFRIA